MIRTVLKYMLIAVIVLSVAGCKRAPPEQRLRDTIAAMQKGVESGSPADFMEAVSPEFVGNEGVDRAGLERLVKAQLLLNSKVSVQTGPIAIEMAADNKTATVRFSALLVGGTGGLLPVRGDMQEIQTGWRDEDGRWRVYSASWGPVGGERG